MTFWGKNTFIARNSINKIVDPFDASKIVDSAYELSLGSEYFTTGEIPIALNIIQKKQKIEIKPGQFAMMICEEKIFMPKGVIGFISIKTKIKFRGLVNVSGFHVDPGFEGHLKFAVYNAGSRSIVLKQGDPVFLLWLADMNDSSSCRDVSPGDGILAEDIMNLQGQIASPAELNERLEKLEFRFHVFVGVASAVAVPFLLGLIGWILDK